MEKATFEQTEENKTGIRCTESSVYCCKLHPYLEAYVNEGDIFPKCEKAKGHNTTWWKKVN